MEPRFRKRSDGRPNLNRFTGSECDKPQASKASNQKKAVDASSTLLPTTCDGEGQARSQPSAKATCPIPVCCRLLSPLSLGWEVA